MYFYSCWVGEASFGCQKNTDFVGYIGHQFIGHTPGKSTELWTPKFNEVWSTLSREFPNADQTDRILANSFQRAQGDWCAFISALFFRLLRLLRLLLLLLLRLLLLHLPVPIHIHVVAGSLRSVLCFSFWQPSKMKLWLWQSLFQTRPPEVAREWRNESQSSPNVASPT